MRVTLPYADASHAIGWLSRVAPATHAVPMLSTLWLRPSGESLTVQAYSGAVWGKASIPADAGEDAGVCVSARALGGIIKAARADIEIAFDGQSLLPVTAGRTAARLPTIPPHGWPSAPDVSALAMSEVEPETFSAALKWAATAAGENARAAAVTGTLVTADAIIGTNGHAAHLFSIPSKVARCLLPPSCIQQIASLLQKGGRFGSDGTIWCAETDAASLTGSCMAGDYPDHIVRGALTDGGSSAIADKSEVLAALAVSDFGGDPTIRVSASDGALKICAEGATNAGGEVVTEVACDGEFPALTLAPRYLAKALAGMPETVVLSVSISEPHGARILRVSPQQKTLIGPDAMMFGMRDKRDA